MCPLEGSDGSHTEWELTHTEPTERLGSGQRERQMKTQTQTDIEPKTETETGRCLFPMFDQY